jgi:hypothetical protein
MLERERKSVLFTATKRNCHKYQEWCSQAEADRKRVAYEREGWNVHVSQSLGRTC